MTEPILTGNTVGNWASSLGLVVFPVELQLFLFLRLKSLHLFSGVVPLNPDPLCGNHLVHLLGMIKTSPYSHPRIVLEVVFKVCPA